MRRNQRLYFTAQDGVVSARLGEKRVALFWVILNRRIEDTLYFLPTLGGHVATISNFLYCSLVPERGRILRDARVCVHVPQQFIRVVCGATHGPSSSLARRLRVQCPVLRQFPQLTVRRRT